METDVSRKVSELISSLKTVEKYSSLRKQFLKLLIMALLAVFSIALCRLLIIYIDYLTITPYLGSIPGPGTVSGLVGNYITFFIPLLVITLAYSFAAFAVINNVLNSRQGSRYDAIQKDDVLSILKIFSEGEKEQIILDVSRAKQGYILFSILKTILYWFASFIVLITAFGFDSFVTGIVIPYWAAGISAAAIVLILRRNRYADDIRKIWYLDSLLWELRWLYTEFRGSEFQA